MLLSYWLVTHSRTQRSHSWSDETQLTRRKIHHENWLPKKSAQAKQKVKFPRDSLGYVPRSCSLGDWYQRVFAIKTQAVLERRNLAQQMSLVVLTSSGAILHTTADSITEDDPACRLDQLKNRYYASQKINVFCTITETNHLPDTFMK